MIEANQLVAHLVGDYLFQSDWMAQNKTKSVRAAMIHAITYTLPFLLLTQSFWALFTITMTHALIDHYRLARYVVWAKEWLAPCRPKPLAECPMGYDPEKPPWMAVWLFIIADNVLHILINGAAVRYL